MEEEEAEAGVEVEVEVGTKAALPHLTTARHPRVAIHHPRQVVEMETMAAVADLMATRTTADPARETRRLGVPQPAGAILPLVLALSQQTQTLVEKALRREIRTRRALLARLLAPKHRVRVATMGLVRRSQRLVHLLHLRRAVLSKTSAGRPARILILILTRVQDLIVCKV